MPWIVFNSVTDFIVHTKRRTTIRQLINILHINERPTTPSKIPVDCPKELNETGAQVNYIINKYRHPRCSRSFAGLTPWSNF